MGRLRRLVVTPSTGFSILAFFLFVAPGLLYDLMSAQKRIRRRESTFTEISRVALVSTACSVIALVVLVILSAIAGIWDKHPLPDVAAMIHGGTTYVADHVAAVSFAWTLGLIVSIGVAVGAFAFVYRGDEATISYTSAWRSVLRDGLPTPTPSVHVRAKLQDGTIWFGQVADYSPDMEVADREIVLCPPIAIRKEGGTLTPLDGKWARVVLPGPEIVSLAVSYGHAQPVTP